MDDKNQFARKPLPYHRKLVKHCGNELWLFTFESYS